MKKTAKMYFQCDKCGKEVEIDITGNTYIDELHKDGYWSIDLGRPGYGSCFDGCDLKFDVCDDCLKEWIDSFKYKNRIYNSGSNMYNRGDNHEENSL